MEEKPELFFLVPTVRFFCIFPPLLHSVYIIKNNVILNYAYCQIEFLRSSNKLKEKHRYRF